MAPPRGRDCVHSRNQSLMIPLHQNGIGLSWKCAPSPALWSSAIQSHHANAEKKFKQFHSIRLQGCISCFWPELPLVLSWKYSAEGGCTILSFPMVNVAVIAAPLYLTTILCGHSFIVSAWAQRHMTIKQDAADKFTLAVHLCLLGTRLCGELTT